MSDRETIAVYDARAKDYAELVDTGAPDARLQDLLDRMNEGDRILDLGCGPGNASRHMAAAGLKVTAWDASEEMVALARAHVDAHQKTFAALADLEPQSFDAVWANFSLLHAARADAVRHIGEIAKALKPGGWFLIAVKSGEGEERDKIGRLYTYFTETELRGCLADAGFEVVRFDQGREPGLSGEDADWISFTASR